MCTPSDLARDIDLKFFSPTFFQKMRMESAEADIKAYRESLVNPGKHPSSKEPSFVDPDVRKIRDRYYNECNFVAATPIVVRAKTGFWVACHVFSVLSGKETWFGENYDTDSRLCANAICEFVVGCPHIYNGADIKNRVLKLDDFALDAKTELPMITKNIIDEAFKRYPVAGIIPFNLDHNRKIFQSKINGEYSDSFAGEEGKDEKVSDKTEPYIPQEVMEIHKRLADKEERKRLRTRAYSGFYTACHVFAYLGGREGLFGDEWNIDQKLCANMILGVLGIGGIYRGEGIDSVVMEPSDFAAEAPGMRPIVLEDTVAEALRRFPVEGIEPDFSRFRGENE